MGGNIMKWRRGFSLSSSDLIVPIVFVMLACLSCAGMRIEEDYPRSLVRIRGDLVLDITGCSRCYPADRPLTRRADGFEYFTIELDCDNSPAELVITRPLRAESSLPGREELLKRLSALDETVSSGYAVISPMAECAVPAGLPCFRRVAHYTRGSRCVAVDFGGGVKGHGDLIIPARSVATWYVAYDRRIIRLQFTRYYDPEEFRRVRDDAKTWEKKYLEYRTNHEAIINRLILKGSVK